LYIEEDEDGYIDSSRTSGENSVFVGSTVIGSDFCFEEVDSTTQDGKNAEKSGYISKAAEIPVFTVNMNGNCELTKKGVVGIDSQQHHKHMDSISLPYNHFEILLNEDNVLAVNEFLKKIA
jgi:hypothetical protein